MFRKFVSVIFLLVSSVCYGSGEEADHVVIARRISDAFAAHAHLLDASKDRDIVAFLGNTGAGKSTLVNILAGVEVVAQGPEYVLRNPGDRRAMAIGEGGDSQTIYPQYIDVDGLRYFDLPGFNDTDGSEQNLVNAAFIHQILTKARTVRPVFVAGEDEFISQRGESVKRFCMSIQKLVVGGDAFLRDGIFIVTRSSFGGKFRTLSDYVEFLLKKTNMERRAELTAQLNEWVRGNRLRYVPCPETDRAEEVLAGPREHIRTIIGMAPPKRITAINISAIYPEETIARLERVFYGMMGSVFARGLEYPLTTITTYTERIGYYERGYWRTFEGEVLRETPSLNLLREFSEGPYQRALKSFTERTDRQRQDHIRALQERREERVREIEQGTIRATHAVIRRIVPRGGDPLLLDFIHAAAIHDGVCVGEGDPQEQEIIRRTHEDFMRLRRWHLIQRMRAEEKPEGRKMAVLPAEAFLDGEMYERFLRGALAAPAMLVAARMVPPIARGHEEFYERFLNGVLIYKPNKGNDVGRVDLPIGALANPLEGTFDLSGCGDTGRYISIHTGYKKAKIAANAKKVEIWFTPKFLVEANLGGDARWLRGIMDKWTHTWGMFWTWGGYDCETYNFDYDLTPRFCVAKQHHNLFNAGRGGVRFGHFTTHELENTARDYTLKID